MMQTRGGAIVRLDTYTGEIVLYKKTADGTADVVPLTPDVGR